MRLMRTVLACASLAMLCACGATTTASAPAATTAAEVTSTPAPGAPHEDTCGATQYAGLIGSNIAAVSFPAGAPIRIIHPGEPVTQDLRPDRLNVILDANGVITALECY